MPINQLTAEGFGMLSGVASASFTGLLDEYPNAAAAYSVRRLNSNYTGALVEIAGYTATPTFVENRAFLPDANNELSLTSQDVGLTTTLGDWINANSIRDGYVRTFYDNSGNAVNAQQTTLSLQAPIIRSGALFIDNGKPMVDFTGGDYYYNLSTTTTVSWAFGVQNVTAIDNIVNYIFGGIGKGCFVGGTTASVTGWGLAGSTGQREANNENLGQIIRAWSSDKLFANGVEERYSQVQSAGDFDLIMLGSRSDALAFSFTGYFQEAVFYNSNQEANVVGIYTNQNDYYGVL